MSDDNLGTLRRILATSEAEVKHLRTEVERLKAENAELTAAKYPGCKVLSLGAACPCKICALERKLAEARQVMNIVALALRAALGEGKRDSAHCELPRGSVCNDGDCPCHGDDVCERGG